MPFQRLPAALGVLASIWHWLVESLATQPPKRPPFPPVVAFALLPSLQVFFNGRPSPNCAATLLSISSGSNQKLQNHCNVHGVSAVRFTTRSRAHCTRPIRTNMHSTPENREAHKRQQRLQGTERQRQSDPQKGSHITGTFSSNIKCTILFIYGPSSLYIPNPVLRLSRITTAVLPVYTALPLP